MFKTFWMPVLFIFFETAESHRSLMTHLAKGGLSCDFISNLSFFHGTSLLFIIILMMDPGSRICYFLLHDREKRLFMIIQGHALTKRSRRYMRRGMCFHSFFTCNFPEQIFRNDKLSPCMSVYGNR